MQMIRNLFAGKYLEIRAFVDGHTYSIGSFSRISGIHCYLDVVGLNTGIWCLSATIFVYISQNVDKKGHTELDLLACAKRYNEWRTVGNGSIMQHNQSIVCHEQIRYGGTGLRPHQVSIKKPFSRNRWNWTTLRNCAHVPRRPIVCMAMIWGSTA